MDDSTSLITLFCYIDDKFNLDLSSMVQRFSNNNKPKFTDVEIITIYIFGTLKKIREIKDIYRFMKTYYADWFPNLPSYEKYNYRLNQIGSVFSYLCEHIINDFPVNNLIRNMLLIDSMPIIMANQKRSNKAKVANYFANKGHCASKGIYYYGAKLHVLGIKRKSTLPLPEYLLLTPATDHDLTVLEAVSPYLYNKRIFADKAYIKETLDMILKNQNVTLYTPVKKEKGQKHLDLFQKLYSSSVSSIRQPIEAFFNWIEDKTGIQKASKVRSFKGLLTHVYGKLSAALFLMVFNS